MRRATTFGTKLPLNAVEKIHDFFAVWNTECNSHTRAEIYGGDHFSIYLDSPMDRTYSEIGLKHIPIVTTGYEKVRLSV
jgi:hypothetical protein